MFNYWVFQKAHCPANPFFICKPLIMYFTDTPVIWKKNRDKNNADNNVHHNNNSFKFANLMSIQQQNFKNLIR